MKTSYIGDVLTITAEKQEDKLLLSVIAKTAEEMSYVSELADGRVKAAQAKMHESTVALASFISEHVPKASLASRIISWVKEKWQCQKWW